jgi:spore maturation protein CgeB
MRIKKPDDRNRSIRQDITGELELFLAQSGKLSARLNRSLGYHYLHSSVKPEDEAVYYGGMELWGDLIVFLGIGLGYHIAPFLKNLPAGARILVVDYYPQFVDHCQKNIFSGLTNAISAVTPQTERWQTVAAKAALGIANIQIVKHPASYHAQRTFYDDVIVSLHRERPRAQAAGHVLLFYGNFFLEEELRRAIKERCGGVSIFNYNDYDGSGPFESALSRAIQQERPQFLLSVNMKGFDGEGIVAGLAARFGIPAAVWFVDDPHPILLHQKSFVNSSIVAFSWERAYIPWLAKQGFGSVHYLPLATDPSLFPIGRASSFGAEVGFVGSAMGRNFLDEIARRFLWRKELEPLVTAAAEALCSDASLSISEILRRTCSDRGIPLPYTDDKNLTWLCSYIIHTASMLQRKKIVGACIPRGIQTFGDPEGWKGLFGETIKTHPSIDYRHALADVYRGIGVNINITSRQMRSAVNQRVFDIPLCGGFVLSDHQADLDELFEPDEVARYDSAETIVDKIDYFISHSAERSAISDRARKKILGEHTYVHRIDSILKSLFGI